MSVCRRFKSKETIGSPYEVHAQAWGLHDAWSADGIHMGYLRVNLTHGDPNKKCAFKDQFDLVLLVCSIPGHPKPLGTSPPKPQKSKCPWVSKNSDLKLGPLCFQVHRGTPRSCHHDGKVPPH